MGRKVLGRGGVVMLPAGVLTLRGRDAMDELRLVQHERNRTTALMLRRIHTAARIDAEGGMRADADRFSGDEVAAASGWSSSVGGRWVEFADDLVGRLPRVLAAMEAGPLEETKARVFSEWTRDLSDEHAAMVADLLLGYAPQMPTGALIQAVIANAIALDPDFAKRREARARKRARVVGSVTPDGTASLSGHDLPLERTVEALGRVEAIADRVRARGVDMPIGLLKSEVFLRLLGPDGAGLDDATLVQALVAEFRDDPDDTGGPDDRGPDDNGPDDNGPDDRGPDDRGGADDAPPGDEGPDGGPAGGGADGGPAGVGAAGGGPEGPDPDECAGESDPATGRDDTGPDDTGDDDEPAGREACGESGEAPQDSEPAPPTRGVRRGVTELRLALSTLLGLDERPAQLVTWGPLLAARAREWVAAHPHAELRIVVVDEQGRLLHVLLTRHRPPGPARRRTSGPRGIVEVQVQRGVLLGLDAARFPAWAGMLTDAQTRLVHLPADGCPDLRPDAVDATGRRRARAELDRWLRTRDRYCAMPGCRRPAQVCDLDHTKAWAQYGPSAAWNLGALCRRHHRLKHLGGWTLRQLDAGEFLWRSRAGMTYLVGARPVMERLPDPVPAAHGRRRLAREWGYPPDRRGLGGSRGREEAPASRKVVREDRIDPTITYVGATRPGTDQDDEPPF